MNFPNHPHDKSRNKVVFGLLMLLLGLCLFLYQVGLLPIVYIWAYWQYKLIALGLLVGVINRFKKNLWWILVLIGCMNISHTFVIGSREIEYSEIIFPFLLIMGGIVMMLRPKRNYPKFGPSFQANFTASDNNTINPDVIFGGRKEIVTSKDFQGGTVNAVFGGCEINLLQADITQSPVVLIVRAVFGGIEVIVPANWEVKSEVETIFGSTQDERSMRMHDSNGDNKKMLILRGSCVFGGVEIKSI
jgi:predicted membrane protein